MGKRSLRLAIGEWVRPRLYAPTTCVAPHILTAIRYFLRKVGICLAAAAAVPHMPGNPPLPRMLSIWRIIFFAPPPLNIFIICCICVNCFMS